MNGNDLSVTQMELEKGFAGSQSSGKTDSGTTARSFGTILNWMQDKTAPVFIAATANKIDALPPEFLRKGRFDEIFFVDLPTEVERKEIWKIHLSRVKNRNKVNIDQLIAISAGFTGAEIEQVVTNGLRLAFHSKKKKLDTEILVKCVETMIPLSETMETEITTMRQWANGRALSASIKDEQSTTRRVKHAETTPKPSVKTPPF